LASPELEAVIVTCCDPVPAKGATFTQALASVAGNLDTVQVWPLPVRFRARVVVATCAESATLCRGAVLLEWGESVHEPKSVHEWGQAEQDVDGNGNVTAQRLYDRNNPSSLLRTYTNTFVSDSNYTSRYIGNRLLTSTLAGGGATVTLASNAHDEGCSGPVPSDVREHDSSYGSSFCYRGNTTRHDNPTGRTTFLYDGRGNASSITTPQGVTTSSNYQNSTNYAAPSSLTTNSLTQSMQWNGFLGLTQDSGPTEILLPRFWTAMRGLPRQRQRRER
jgi:YD repeat-containing protein